MQACAKEVETDNESQFSNTNSYRSEREDQIEPQKDEQVGADCEIRKSTQLNMAVGSDDLHGVSAPDATS